MSTDLLQQLLEVDQKAREQERIHLIQNFFNLGSVKLQEKANFKIENQNRTSAIGFQTTNDDDDEDEI